MELTIFRPQRPLTNDVISRRDGGSGHQREVRRPSSSARPSALDCAPAPSGDAARRSDRDGGGNRFFLPAISFITDLLRPGDTIHPVSRRLARVPSAAALRGQAPIAGPPRAVLDAPNRYQETPFIVTRKHRSTSRRRRRPYCTISSRAARWGISRHAERLGTAAMGRDTYANQAAALAVAVICVLVAGCGSTIGNAESTTTTRSMIPRPLVERELAGLLLSPEQVNAAMGTAGSGHE